MSPDKERRTDLAARVSELSERIQKLDELLTYEVQLEDINKAFELLKEPDCVKVLIKF